MANEVPGKYWRSHEGGEEYRALLDKHYQTLFSTCDGAQLVRRAGEIEIYAMHGHPIKGATTIITKGMSGFILDGGVRIEQAISLREPFSKDWAAELMITLASAALQNRRPFQEHSIIGNVDFSGFGSCVTVQHLIVLLGHWFQDSEFHISNYYPGHVLEFVPLLDSEAKLVTRDVEEFYRLGRDGLIDTLDLFRKDRGELH